MNISLRILSNTKQQWQNFGRIKKTLFVTTFIAFLTSTFLYMTPPGQSIMKFLAKTVITTQHREWAWILVGAEKRDQMVQAIHDMNDRNAKEKQDLNAVSFNKNKSIDQLVKVVDISGDYWVGKMMYVFDPRSIRVVVPGKKGEGERITSMVERTGAVAGVNGGGFIDPDGLGNGFAPIGAILSGGKVLYNDQKEDIPQHIVGFTDKGTLVIGKYSIDQLRAMKVSEAVSFYPRVIANGKPLITKGDGGWGRAPRTALGQRADGTVIFVVIDGRQAHSVGATLREVQDLLLEQGCINAGFLDGGATLREVQDLLLEQGCINAGFLDGGASSEMVKDRKLLTQPSSRYGERRLPSGFLIFNRPKDVEVHNIWEGLKEIDPGGPMIIRTI
ncbi:phosphodiester glycosidase family protein [Paenibacillus larvae]